MQNPNRASAFALIGVCGRNCREPRFYFALTHKAICLTFVRRDIRGKAASDIPPDGGAICLACAKRDIRGKAASDIPLTRSDIAPVGAKKQKMRLRREKSAESP